MLNRILGVDPGYGRVGIAILEKNKTEEKLIYSECFETNPKLPHHQRLLLIAERIAAVIDEHNPNQIAIETLLWSKNKKTAMRVAEARGVILVEASRKNLRIREFNPNEIKLAVTGYGKSDKKQIISMVEKILKIKDKKKHDDEYDAMACAITCASIPISTEFL
jgi:crossover junction endodeoxyribonuclease RuvC